MPLTILDGDIFKISADAIVNPINPTGVARGGLAKVYRDRFPDNYDAVMAAAKKKELSIGKVLVTEGGGTARYIFNVPTVRTPGGVAHAVDIEKAMDAIVDNIIAHDIQSIAIPALGGGVGKLPFSEIEKIVKESSELVPHVSFLLFRPKNTSKSNSSRKPSRSRRKRRRKRHGPRRTIVLTLAGAIALAVVTAIVEVVSSGVLTRLLNLE